MTENKRFTFEVLETGLYFIERITDNLEKNTFTDVKTATDLLNRLWEQTQRFEKHNQDLVKENEQLKERIDEYTDLCADISEIKEENDELKYQVNYLRDKLEDYLRFEQENWKLKQKMMELDEVKWLRENTVWEQMPTNRKTTFESR